METLKLYNTEMQWYKGNTHTHTTKSDGQKDPDEVIALYKEQGYDFLAITDHRKYMPLQEQDSFTLIPATEFHMNNIEGRKAFHIVGLGIEKELFTSDENTPQELIDMILEAGGLPILAHPAWSFLTHDDLAELQNYEHIEIYNSVSEFYSFRGNSSEVVDSLAACGLTKHLIACDDTHFYKKEFAKGFIRVQSPSLSSRDLVQSIAEGKYYSSQCPAFKQIEVSEGGVQVSCSPVKKIIFLSDAFYAQNRVVEADEGQLITEAEYKYNNLDTYLRVELVDEHGNHAWSNYFLKAK